MEPTSGCQGLKNALPQLEKELEELEKAKNEGMETGEFYDFDRKAENFQDHIKTLIQQYKKLATQEINGFLEQRDNKDEPCTFKFDDDFRVVINGNLDLGSYQILPRFPQIIKTITGGLYVDSAQTLNLPQLEKVGGSFNAPKAQTLDLPQLKEVGGDLRASNAQTLNLPQLREITGALSAREAQTLNLPQLEKVGGYLFIYNAKTLNLPQLKEVGDYFNASNVETLELPQLKEVGDYFNASNVETLELPQIVSIKGDLYIPEERKDLIKQAEDWKNEGILQGKIKRV